MRSFFMDETAELMENKKSIAICSIWSGIHWWSLDNGVDDKKNDEIDLIEKHFNVNINVYTIYPWWTRIITNWQKKHYSLWFN